MPRAGAVLGSPPACPAHWLGVVGLAGPWLLGSALVLTMGTPTAAPATLADRELSALGAHQQADNIKVFFSNLPFFS